MSSSNTSTTGEKLLGQVKWFNNQLNYGFVTVISEGEHNNDDIFVHQTSICPVVSNYRTLTQGEYVEYNTTTDDKGKVLAVNVTGIKQGPLLCERPKKSKKTNDKKSSESDQTTHEVKAVTDSQ